MHRRGRWRSSQVKVFERAEQWFSRYEADSGRHSTEYIGAIDEPTILDRHTHPYVLRPTQVAGDLGKATVALGTCDDRREPSLRRHGR